MVMASPEVRTPRAASPAWGSSATTDSHRACDELWREGRVEVAFKEEPETLALERKGPRLERQFQVARQLRGAYRHADQWASVLQYAKGEVHGGVSYGLTVPEVLADLTGRILTWASHREPASCLSGDGDQPALLAGDTLRDEQGRLLLLTVPSAPTTPDGEVLLPPGLVPELKVHWELAGCEAKPGERTRGARLRFEGPRGRDSAPVTVSVGETKQLLLKGLRYEVRVARARADASDRCGQAVFTLFREGLRERL
ncbi:MULTISPECIES: hypothetical protein [Myxococcus]|uniref:hypothetical protein n=1 Tax=Myxococcus TaxID=32 RepID=UPI001891CA39|nr:MULTISPECIES: hypothetical protein [Myxococcus]MCK8500642.1 hypothetical protein [Myxococcus fulvus]